jgi:WhiB family transcriptional regulator, redox-sensing transcriptional regulator
VSRRGRGADGRNGGHDEFGHDGYRPGGRRVRLGRGRHRVGRHRADRQHEADIGRDRPGHLRSAELAGGAWPGVHPAELDRLAGVPDEVLSALVAQHGRCVWEISSGDPPGWSGQGTPERELAARLCAGCPVRAECLEFELRTAAADTVGVWGGLAEDDRRALYVMWSARSPRRPDAGPDQGPDEEVAESASDSGDARDGGDR